jgi:2-polyprenyl-3-methyl-5-hydroxy-6-metoxy-1,4-benzoquinol methylase
MVQEVLEAIAKKHGWPTDVARLAPKVAALSQAYNTRGTSTGEHLAARLLFSFTRDVPKATAAVRELGLSGDLSLLDVGAGLGASTYGVARATSGKIAATWVDTDARAMELGAEIVRAQPLNIELRERRSDLPRGTFDLVLLGQVLSEIPPEEHDAFVDRALERVKEDGSLVIIEPALRERARRLHELRARLIGLGDKRRTIFAPCLHHQACPMLVKETDWCHEDLPIDLPDWLVPVARAAGLRWQGLTFAYLIVRKDGRRLGGQLRAVSSLIKTKGKSEVFVCGEAVRGRLMRLDREKSPANEAWADLERGDILSVDPPPDPDKPRVAAASRVIRNLP